MSEHECTKSSPEPALQPSDRQDAVICHRSTEADSADGHNLSTLKPWYVYLVRAANGSLYCGITLDPQRRLQQHQNGRGARFFYSSPAQDMVYLEECVDKGSALKRELAIKRLSKQQKERLVQNTLTVQSVEYR